MKDSASFVAVAAVSVAMLMSSCVSGQGSGASDSSPAAQRPSRLEAAAAGGTDDAGEPSSPPQGNVVETGTKPAPHTDQVPGALQRMRPWPGLADAVTAVVMRSPKGRIHGHDAERIDIEVDDAEGTARVRFVMLPSFELHGDREVGCVRTDGTWRCRDES